MKDFDVIVVGLGHAGAEAALAASRLGCRTAAITQSLERACLMSCNPAIGGPGKSQLVHEIDALGGSMPEATDLTVRHLRLLNRSKGPAIHATRALVDRAAYAQAMQQRLVAAANLSLIEDEVAGLLLAEGRVEGVRLRHHGDVLSAAVVLTTGTFLSAVMHTGDEARPGGRHGDESSTSLSHSLRDAGLRMARFRTGTPPRLLGPSIDFGRCVEQPSEPDARPFSQTTDASGFPVLPQLSCFTTRTGPATHRVVRDNMQSSPLFAGSIQGRGPRYCPALELKVVQHPDREGHLVHLEPEGEKRDVIYPAGLSTSLPAPVQQELLRTIPGLESVEMVRPGYAVEYDYVVSGQLQPWLEVIPVGGLFTAGQINGSSGYEEAAGQGLVAGVNAARSMLGHPPWVPDPRLSYLGVLCQDLTQRGFDEPYRLLPARAEERLSLREGNAGIRLGPTARELGIVDAEKLAPMDALREEVNAGMASLSEDDRRQLRNPGLTLQDAPMEVPELARLSQMAASEVYLEVRYSPYVAQKRLADERLARFDGLAIPSALRFAGIAGLSGEAVEILESRRPCTLAEARGLPGINASALAVLLAHLRRRDRMALQ
jgi:tRNA uridine 5-carboxymethylaminomethyl modification enzyme